MGNQERSRLIPTLFGMGTGKGVWGVRGRSEGPRPENGHDAYYFFWPSCYGNQRPQQCYNN
eukprot:1097877-Pelagomonas_calceolata.AAC.4